MNELYEKSQRKFQFSIGLNESLRLYSDSDFSIVFRKTWSVFHAPEPENESAFPPKVSEIGNAFSRASQIG